MPSNTTSTLSNSVRARYEEEYYQGAEGERLYDQFSFPASADKEKLQRGSSIVLNFISDLAITQQTISETSDVTPNRLYDATVSITPTSRRNAIQDSEKLLLEHYTDYGAQRFGIVGKNMQQSVDFVAMEAMLQGSLVDRATARASLDAGTAAHRLALSDLALIEARLADLRSPKFVGKGVPSWLALMGPAPFYDLRSSGDVQAVAQYQDKRILLNNELGEAGAFRIVVSPFAKIFGAAGADNGTAIATTVATAVDPLDKTITVASGTNIAAGMRITIGTEETANTFYPTNEIVEVVSVSGADITIVGGGANGGVMYAHDVGEAFRNADNVYPVAYGGPMSIAKVYASEVGEFGQVVGPKLSGILDQFVTLGWKWYGGYGRPSEAWLLRGEYTSSIDA